MLACLQLLRFQPGYTLRPIHCEYPFKSGTLIIYCLLCGHLTFSVAVDWRSKCSPYQQDDQQQFFAISSFVLVSMAVEGCHKIHPSADVHIIVHGYVYVYCDVPIELRSLNFWFTQYTTCVTRSFMSYPFASQQMF